MILCKDREVSSILSGSTKTEKTAVFSHLTPYCKHSKPLAFMSRFNKKKSQAALMVNRQGGIAYKRSAEYRLVALLLTNFVTDQFYRKANQSLAEMTELLEQVE